MVKFSVGFNQPWLQDRYGTDLSYNQFSGQQLWKWPYSDPIDFDFSKPDPNPPLPLALEDPIILAKTLDQFKGMDVVRIWLFEHLEGIVFLQNGRIGGIDTQMLDVVEEILDLAQERGLKIYFCLLNSWDSHYNLPDQFKNNPARTTSYDILYNTMTSILKGIVADPTDFCTRVLKTLYARVMNHPALYGFDLLNEPEGLFENGHCSEMDIVRYIKFCADTIRSIRVQRPFSVGWMRRENAIKYSYLTDFSDFHFYNNYGADLPQYYREDFDGKPCIIGECGYPVVSGQNIALKIQGPFVAKTIVNLALKQGYYGALAWPLQGTDLQDSNQSLQESLKNMALIAYPVRASPPKPWNFWKFFFGIFEW